MMSAGMNIVSMMAQTPSIPINVVCLGISPGGVVENDSKAKLTMAAQILNTIADRLYGHCMRGCFTVPMKGSYMKS